LQPPFRTLARTVPRGLGRGEVYGDTVDTFLERPDNATLVVAAEILGLPAPSLLRSTRFEMSLPTRFGGMGVGGLVALADAAHHVGAAGLAVGSAIRFLSAQDARVRGRSHDDVPMEPNMYGRLATAMITAVSRQPGAPDTDVDDNELIWSLELASAWARLDAVCGSHALTESEPLITAALAMLPPKRPTSRRLRSRSTFKQPSHYYVPLWLALARTLLRVCHGHLSKATSRHQ
jgi:hypothetical protein